MGERREERVRGGEEQRVGGGGGAQTPDRSRQPDARVFARARRVLIHAHDGADAGDEHRRAGLDAEPHQRRHVSHLVHVDQQHEAGRELPAPDRPVDAHRGQHRQQRARLRQSGQQQLALGEHQRDDELELPQQRADETERRQPFRHRARGGRHRRVVAGERVDPRADGRGLWRVARHQVERAAPGDDGIGGAAGGLERGGLAGQPCQRVGMHEASARRALAQGRCDLGAAPCATAGRGERVRHRAPAAAGAAAGRPGASPPGG